MKSWMWSIVVVGVCAAMSGSAQAQELPKAEDLLDGYVKATGGKDAYMKYKTRSAKGGVSIAGLEGKLSMYQSAPDKMYMELELPMVGKIASGTDGKIVWESNPITGASIKKGDDRASAVRSASFYGDVEWRKYFKKVETVGEAKVGEIDCYKVEMTPNEGKAVQKYYDKKTGLLAKMTTRANSPMGELTVDVITTEYKEFDGIKMATKARQVVAGQELVLTLDRVEHGMEIPADRFAIPDNVKKLLEQ